MNSHAPIRLLTIDDDDRLRRSLRIYFEDSGMTVFEAANGVDGLAAFAEHQPDVALVDLNMPGMNGLEVIAELARLSPETPAIVVSGTGDLNDAVEAVHRGVWDFVTKPIVSMGALENTVRQCVDRARLKKENERYRLHLEELVELRTQEVERTRLQIIQRLGRAAEYRDNETGMHVIRMSHFSRLLALKAGMSERDAEILWQAAPMHDVGKIGIPDYILLKPGKLTPEEMDVMKGHSRLGYELLQGSGSEILRAGAEIAISHHEKYDGSGYPNGLKGKEIPLYGRIVAVADVFDALTSERPYKKAWPLEDAVRLLEEGRGSHFDPMCVEAFLASWDQVIEIRQRFQDKVTPLI